MSILTFKFLLKYDIEVSSRCLILFELILLLASVFSNIYGIYKRNKIVKTPQAEIVRQKVLRKRCIVCGNFMEGTSKETYQPTIIQNPTDAQKKEHDKSTLETHEVYAMDVLISKGEGVNLLSSAANPKSNKKKKKKSSAEPEQPMEVEAAA